MPIIKDIITNISRKVISKAAHQTLPLPLYFVIINLRVLRFKRRHHFYYREIFVWGSMKKIVSIIIVILLVLILVGGLVVALFNNNFLLYLYGGAVAALIGGFKLKKNNAPEKGEFIISPLILKRWAFWVLIIDIMLVIIIIAEYKIKMSVIF